LNYGKLIRRCEPIAPRSVPKNRFHRFQRFRQIGAYHALLPHSASVSQIVHPLHPSGRAGDKMPASRDSALRFPYRFSQQVFDF
jgi:hypothetical protein